MNKIIMSSNQASLTLNDAQAEFAENEKLIAELQKRNAELEVIILSKGGKTNKRVLQDVSNASNKKARPATELTVDQICKQTAAVTRKVQGQISAKLKWKRSFSRMVGTKGGRVEVVCKEPAVFEEIFKCATIKKGKDGKLSCAFKTDDEVAGLPFRGKSYPYSRAELRAPCSASLKDCALVFSFKYSVY